jgi:hypothetical protein
MVKWTFCARLNVCHTRTETRLHTVTDTHRDAHRHTHSHTHRHTDNTATHWHQTHARTQKYTHTRTRTYLFCSYSSFIFRFNRVDWRRRDDMLMVCGISSRTQTHTSRQINRFRRVARELYAVTCQASLSAGLPLRLVLIASFNGIVAGSKGTWNHTYVPMLPVIEEQRGTWASNGFPNVSTHRGR